ncbi:MAG: chorismate synthase [Candidatus Saliniplasma sp.]
MKGREFSFSLFGESHGKVVGVLIEGCPPGVEVDEQEMKVDLERRKGQKRFSTERRERDEPEILSGIFNGRTTGAPVTVIVKNKDVDSTFYEKMKDKPRPGHSDYTAGEKFYGYNDYRGGGVFSGRLAVGTVIAGYFAKKILSQIGVEIRAFIRSIGKIECRECEIEDIFDDGYDLCPDDDIWERMQGLMKEVQDDGDSIGGIVEVVAKDVVTGLGGPFDEDLAADLSKNFFSIPAVKGVEFGSGFEVSEMCGSEANDEFYFEDGNVRTSSNHCGGILGGISDGMPIVARIAFKPTPSIFKEQETVDLEKGEDTGIKLKGRFDSCIVPKTLPIVEARMAAVIADHFLRWCSWKEYMNLERE